MNFFSVLTCALLATVECLECKLASELADNPSCQAARSEEIYALQVLAFRPVSPVQPFFQAETSSRDALGVAY